MSTNTDRLKDLAKKVGVSIKDKIPLVLSMFMLVSVCAVLMLTIVIKMIVGSDISNTIEYAVYGVAGTILLCSGLFLRWAYRKKYPIKPGGKDPVKEWAESSWKKGRWLPISVSVIMINLIVKTLRPEWYARLWKDHSWTVVTIGVCLVVAITMLKTDGDKWREKMAKVVIALCALGVLCLIISNTPLMKQLVHTAVAETITKASTLPPPSRTKPHTPKEVIAPHGVDEGGEKKWGEKVLLFGAGSFSTVGPVSIRTSDGVVHGSKEDLKDYPTSSYEFWSETEEDIPVNVLQ